MTITATPKQRHNFKHLYHDIFWWGVLAGSTLAFLPIFLARVNSSSLQLGILAAGPALISLVFALPAGRWLKNSQMVRATFLTSVWQRFGYLLILAITFILREDQQVYGIIATIIFFSIGGTFVAISFNAMFADIVAAPFRTKVVGNRNALIALSSTLTTLLCGYILENFTFPYNYQIVFCIGVVGAALSSYHLSQLIPETPTTTRMYRPMRDMAHLGNGLAGAIFHRPISLRAFLNVSFQKLIRFDLLRTGFGSIMLGYFIFYISQNMSLPLFPLFFVQTLKMGDGAISVASAVFNGAMFVFSLALTRFNQRKHLQHLFHITVILYGTYPLIVGFAQNTYHVIVASLLGGIIWAFVNVGLIEWLMDAVPDDQRSEYMAIHTLVANAGVLIGAFIGPAVADTAGLRESILAGGLSRVLAGIILVIILGKELSKLPPFRKIT